MRSSLQKLQSFVIVVAPATGHDERIIISFIVGRQRWRGRSGLPCIDSPAMAQFSLVAPEATNKSPAEREKEEAKANGLALWLLSYYFPPKIRKCAGGAQSSTAIEAKSNQRGCIELVASNDNAEFDFKEWEDKARAALKKILVEDLGKMDAPELLTTIPETDAEGRGMVDLRSMEKKLSVKVVFDDVTGHVYLVGDAKKIDKKCFALRNMLSHYHWRLSGKDVALS